MATGRRLVPGILSPFNLAVPWWFNLAVTWWFNLAVTWWFNLAVTWWFNLAVPWWFDLALPWWFNLSVPWWFNLAVPWWFNFAVTWWFNLAVPWWFNLALPWWFNLGCRQTSVYAMIRRLIVCPAFVTQYRYLFDHLTTVTRDHHHGCPFSSQWWSSNHGTMENHDGWPPLRFLAYIYLAPKGGTTMKISVKPN